MLCEVHGLNKTLFLTQGCSFRRVHSGILQDMSILGYLGHLQSPDIGVVLPLHSLVPYQVKELFGMACSPPACREPNLT